MSSISESVLRGTIKKKVTMLRYIHLTVIFMVPLLLVDSYLKSSWELISLQSALLLATVLHLTLNSTIKSKTILHLYFTFVITHIWFITYFDKMQTGAPYSMLLLAYALVVIIDNVRIRNLLVPYAFITFTCLTYFQNKYREFDDYAYFPLFIVGGIFCIGVVKLVKTDNITFNENIDIHQKTLKQVEKTEEKVGLKKREIETLVSQLQLQQRVKDEMSLKLNKIINADNLKMELNRMIKDLNFQHEVGDRIRLISSDYKKLQLSFHNRLKENFPTLSKSELELCSWIKLGLSSKEIADLRNTRGNTINVMKSRVRKKMNLEEDLYSFLNKF